MSHLRLMSQVVRPSDSPSGYRNPAPSHPLPPATCPRVHPILRRLIPPVQRQGEGSFDLKMSVGKRRGRARRTTLPLAFHSPALSKVPPKEVSAFNSLVSLGDSHSGTSYWDLTCFPKGSHVAKDPMVTLSFGQCCPTWNSRQKLPPP